MRAIALAAGMAMLAASQSARPVPVVPPTIYSADPADSWNRLFAALFTRTVRTRYTSEFPGRGPFEAPQQPFAMLPQASQLRVSARVFDREEDGDRAIDALYPAFLSYRGVRDRLSDARRGELLGALNAALADATPRTPLARALMQADVWSAHDVIAEMLRERRDLDAGTRAAADEAETLIARLIGRLALTRAEIAALPDTYAQARRSLALPDLFRGGGDWLEVAWTTFHLHENAAHQRRAARVLMHPAARPANVPAFLANAVSEHPLRSFSAVALVEQMMLVDRSGRVVASPIARNVQLRTFTPAADGAFRSSAVSELELSRRKILANPSGVGFLRFDDAADAYLPTAGNDYGFASPALPQSEPTISTLRLRCSGCHGPDGTHIVSFSVAGPAELPPPRALPQPNDERVRAVAVAKEARDDFKRLTAAAFGRRR